ncbi:uncharacterized protein LOC127700596 isoform X1 [Mytilus californianus]|uniref:uncharacterized protein LOC127700596 isoform X1 n=2 Tax=Mytilus californianus TaxID=6549 RepID=UPI0022484793|nr:uncharacterized protein LOC127700596 isoform X1 [Mytilus californianus]
MIILRSHSPECTFIDHVEEMDTKQKILTWTLEYACKYKFHNVISAVSQNASDIEDWNVSRLYLVTSGLHCIVTSADYNSYPQAIQFLEYLYENCIEFIPFRAYSKLVTGIKMMVLLKMLELNKEGVLVKLNEYFPRSGADYPGADKKELKRLSSVYSNFRKFYLPLAAEEKLRTAYFVEEFHEEYGPEFHAALKRLTENFLSKIESYLPVTVLERFMQCSEDKCYELHQDSSSAAFEIFLDVILTKSKLSESDLIHMLTMLGTITECDRVQPLDHTGLRTSSERTDSRKYMDGSKSLFSSSSNYDKNSIKRKGEMLSGKSSSSLSDDVFNSHSAYEKNTFFKAKNSNSSVYNSHETYKFKNRFDPIADHSKNYSIEENKNSNGIHMTDDLTDCELARNCQLSSCVHKHVKQLTEQKCDICKEIDLPTGKASTRGQKIVDIEFLGIKPIQQSPTSLKWHTKLTTRTINMRSMKMPTLRLRGKPTNENLKGDLESQNIKKKNSNILKDISGEIDRQTFVAQYVDNLELPLEIDNLECNAKENKFKNDHSDSQESSNFQLTQSVVHDVGPGPFIQEPTQVQYISSSSEEKTQNGTVMETAESENFEIFTCQSTPCPRSPSNIDIIDSMSDASFDDEVLVPTSDLDEIDLDDIYNFDEDRLSPVSKDLAVPEISSHARHPDLKLCIIKLYRKKGLDVKDKRKKKVFHVYS